MHNLSPGVNLYMSMTNEVASIIFDKLVTIQNSDIYLIRYRSLEYVKLIVSVYNWATSPSRHMTDKEYKACNHLARLCKKRLAVCSDWQETEDGLLTTN